MSIRNDRTDFFRDIMSALKAFHPFPPTAVNAIVNFVKPEKQRALRRYLGMVNYYHRFIPHCAEKFTPSNSLLTEANEGQNRFSPKSNFELHWTENANVAFTESRQILANATLLVHPQPSAPLNITCDAIVRSY